MPKTPKHNPKHNANADCSSPGGSRNSTRLRAKRQGQLEAASKATGTVVWEATGKEYDILQEFYRTKSKCPSDEECAQLSVPTGLSTESIRNWFEHTRRFDVNYVEGKPDGSSGLTESQQALLQIVLDAHRYEMPKLAELVVLAERLHVKTQDILDWFVRRT